ncbi:GAF domain-containing protein [Blastococcus sp. TF02A-26]|uniref:sensor histidine kinase n=1 Tax=Blastococcus sp. TF02A-26 TaxID=2250577 RepID=UPI000DEAC883|nr:GAF domain-containing protein [Blastococcus sp. TF02A-26]RBY82736.1 histidine kinase [Blastococcus sp. TF02A-26]
MPPLDREGTAAATRLAAALRAAASVRGAADGGRLDATLSEVVRTAVEHAGATFGALGVLSADGRRLERFVVVGMDDEDAARIGRLPDGRGILGLLVDDPVPLRLDDLSSHPAAVGLPPGHPPMRSFLGVPVPAGERVFGHLYLTEKRGGGGFTGADEEVVEALAAAAGLAVENARLAEAAERRQGWAQAAAAVVTSLLSGTDPDRVLHEVAERVTELADADLCGVLAPHEGDEDTFTVLAAAGERGADAEGVRMPMAGTRLRAAHAAGVPVLLDDITAVAESRPYAPVVRELMAGGFGPGLVVPLPGRPAPATIVAVRSLGRPAFDAETLELASAFTAQVGVALELARSQARERDLRVSADRDRIARDLHDHVVQRIYATGLALDRISRSLESEVPAAAARIAERVDELDETIARIRTAIFELHEDSAGSSDVVRARLAEVVRSVTEGHGLRVDLRVRDGSEDLPPALVHDVVAVVRELLTNVVRHAGATRVTVEVLADGEVAVVVTDDGCGMPAVAARSGLANLADRAERRGGRMVVTAGPPGTAVRWAVPHPPPG